jgi:hypothetical protein
VSDPVRLVQKLDGEAGRVLGSIREDQPPGGSQVALLASLGFASAVGSGLVAASGKAVPHTAAKAAGTAAWWSAPAIKGAVLLSLTTASIVGVAIAVKSARTTEAAPTASTARTKLETVPVPLAPEKPASPSEPSVAITQLPDSPPPVGRPTPARREKAQPALANEPPAPQVEAKHSNALAEELERLDDARSRLADGNAPGALVALDEHDRLYPSGALSHEAAAMRVDTLFRLGRSDEAIALANAFLAAHPESAQAPRVRQLLKRRSIP